MVNNLEICIEEMENKMDYYMMMMECRHYWPTLQPLLRIEVSSL